MGFTLCTDWQSNNTSRPEISITRTGNMFWNSKVAEFYVTGSKNHLRIFFDRREMQLGISICKANADGSVEFKLSEKKRTVIFNIQKLFRQLGLDHEQYVGKYSVRVIGDNHEIDFYIDLKQHQEQV